MTSPTIQDSGILSIEHILGAQKTTSPLHNPENPHHILLLHEDNDRHIAAEIAEALQQQEVPYFVGAHDMHIFFATLLGKKGK